MAMSAVGRLPSMRIPSLAAGSFYAGIAVSPLKALGHEYATDTGPGGNFAKTHPPVFFIKTRGLKTDRVKYRRAASPTSSLVFECPKDFCPESRTTQRTRQMEKVEKSQSQGGSSNSASQHFVARGVFYDYIECASITQPSGVLIKFVQTFAENYFKFRVCILSDHDYLILQSLPFLFHCPNYQHLLSDCSWPNSVTLVLSP